MSIFIIILRAPRPDICAIVIAFSPTRVFANIQPRIELFNIGWINMKLIQIEGEININISS